MESFRRVSGEDRYFGLGNDLACVHARVHEMHRAAGDLDAGCERLSPRLQSRKGGQKRRMDIDDAAWEGFEKWSFDEAHVASEDDQLGAGCLEFLDKLGLDILGKAGSEFRLVDHGCGDSKIISQRQNAGVGHIRRREHGCDPEMSRHDRGEDRAEVGTFSRTENGNFKLRHEFTYIARQTRARGVLSFRNFRNLSWVLSGRSRLTMSRLEFALHNLPMNVKIRFAFLHKKVDQALERWLPDEKAKPKTLHAAMRYSVFAGGKRLRPVLCLAAAEACGGTIAAAMPSACAIECIHTYSLVHDDLPCMDDDDLRRGRPTTHKVFGEGLAVLTGDALLTMAFEILARTKATARHDMADFLRALSSAAGSSHLIGGQVADVEAEKQKVSPAGLEFIHLGKTAAMISVSLRLGAMTANATEAECRSLGKFGTHLGLAFQIVDDILDITQTSEQLGKSAGKDVAAGKATYPAVFGLEKSRKEAARHTKLALQALKPLGERASFLRGLAEYLLSREF